MVSASASSRGFATAGHCSNAQNWSAGSTGSAVNTSTYVAQAWTPTADLQFHRINSPHSTSNTFFGSSASSATIRSGSGSAFVGQLLCHRGKITGYSCGEVVSTAFAPTWDQACQAQACQAVFVKVQHSALQGQGGDSGGPWFNGAAAYGIHKGGGIGWKAYTPVSRLSALGLTLM